MIVAGGLLTNAMALGGHLVAQELVLEDFFVSATTSAVSLGHQLELPLDDWVRGEPFQWGAETAPQFTVLTRVRAGDEAFENVRQYLGDIHASLGENGVRVLGLAASRGEVTANDLGFDLVVGFDEKTSALPPLGSALVVAADGVVIWSGRIEDGPAAIVSHALQAADRESLVKSSQEEYSMGFSLRTEWWDDLSGDETYRRRLRDRLEINPHHAVIWAACVGYHIDVVGDPEAALAEARLAIRALGDETRPLGIFIDRMLRVMPRDPAALQLALTALAPIAPSAPNDMDLQLAYLRTLCGLERIKEAKRLVKQLEALLAERPARFGDFAEVLISGPTPIVFGAEAQRAIKTARANEPKERLWQMIEYEVFASLGEAAAEKLGEDYLERAEAGASLNNWTWYLVTDEPYRGRVPRLAELCAERLLQQPGTDSAEYDTAALALFRVGRLDDAIEAQTTSIARGGGQSYRARLKLYEAARDRRDR